MPSDPTSAHWYDGERFAQYMVAKINQDPHLTVRAFVGEFRGMTGSGKQSLVLEQTGASRVSLNSFFGDERRANKTAIDGLLTTMKGYTKPVKPKDLGIIGEDHLRARFAVLGVDDETFRYRSLLYEASGLPYVIECAFGAYRERHDKRRRRIITGINWSVALGDPFRELAGPVELDEYEEDGEGRDDGLGSVLTALKASASEPIVLALHVVCPRFDFTDHGKTAIAIPETTATNIVDLVTSVTRIWTKQRKAEEREASARVNRWSRLHRRRRETQKDVAYEAIARAYLKVSDNSTLPANARQIMYAARDEIQEHSGKKLDDNYFTQILLPNYMDEHDCADWDVVFDARGHFTEPHTGRSICLSTVDVRGYLANIRAPIIREPGFAGGKVSTYGPEGRYGSVVFTEKEGFHPLFEHAKLAVRFDITLMSTKGMSVYAARHLIDEVCGGGKIPLLVLHDFDKAGFSIFATLRRATKRYVFRHNPKIIDIGLRLQDVRDLGLDGQAEQAFDRGSEESRFANMIGNGAAEEEARFMLTKRVELNALTSGQLITFIERKFREHGVTKVVSDADQLAAIYQMFRRSVRARAIIKKHLRDHDPAIRVPADLGARVQELLKDDATLSWDEAVRRIVEDGDNDAWEEHEHDDYEDNDEDDGE